MVTYSVHVDFRKLSVPCDATMRVHPRDTYSSRRPHLRPTLVQILAVLSSAPASSPCAGRLPGLLSLTRVSPPYRTLDPPADRVTAFTSPAARLSLPPRRRRQPLATNEAAATLSTPQHAVTHRVVAYDGAASGTARLLPPTPSLVRAVLELSLHPRSFRTPRHMQASQSLTHMAPSVSIFSLSPCSAVRRLRLSSYPMSGRNHTRLTSTRMQVNPWTLELSPRGSLPSGTDLQVPIHSVHSPTQISRSPMCLLDIPRTAQPCDHMHPVAFHCAVPSLTNTNDNHSLGL